MIEYRPARPHELVILSDVENDAQQTVTEAGIFHGFERRALDYYEREIQGAHIIVAAEGDEIAGFAAIVELDDQAHLYELSVRYAHSRKGIGRSLVGAASAFAENAGYRAITLTTCRDVPFNHPFYETCGFQVFEPDDKAWRYLAGALKTERARWGRVAERVAMIRLFV